MKGLVRISVAVVALLAAGWFLAQFGSTRLSPGSVGAKNYVGQFEAAEFPQGLDWLNTGGEELSLAELRGKIVLLDFWTYGCINCIHVIPDLKKLEATYADELVVIGVHSAKFERESETDNIRRLVMRYELEHPVVNDKDFRIWKSYHAQGWPHLAMIDPKGKLIGTLSGEGHYEFLDNLIGKVIEEFDAKGVIDRTPVTWILESESLAPTDLLFPGRVLADAAAKRLFIADSNHNRIVITDLDGVVIDVIGSGEIGLVDGDYEETLFFRPQGLALAGADTLYVADTENHAIRRVDLDKRKVTTVVGTGEQVFQARQEIPPSAGINSPWDVLVHDGRVYIAMAGQHQLWVYDPEDETLEVFAGSLREELTDGPRLKAGLNQPSGLSTDGRRLFVADSEASAIRVTGFDEDAELETIIGTGLFDFGDVDGKGRKVRLQHPLDVEYLDGVVYVADTYNSKIKILDPQTAVVKSFIGGMDELDEPGGISIAGDKIYIADTNNHRIVVADLIEGSAMTLVLTDPERLLARD